MSEHEYLDLLEHVAAHGVHHDDRTGVGTRSVTGAQMRFDLSKGFPLLTTKRIPLRMLVATELLWFMQGRTDKQWLTERNCHIWDEWSAPGHPGFIGPGYGWQWRCSGADYDPGYAPGWRASERGVDQLAGVLHSLRTNPSSRRHIVDAWAPEAIDRMALPPCHMSFQFVVQDSRLDIVVTQRSADMFLGVPVNIASYALLDHIVAREVGLVPGELVWNGGDVHVYDNHLDAVATQLSRTPTGFPTLHMAHDVERVGGDILPRYEPTDFSLIGYEPHPAIKAPVAV